MPTSEVNLVNLFNSVTKALQQNQSSLNEADPYNHNHGDNMVKNFQVITKAVKQKKGASPSEQLLYASEILRKSTSSGSANFYAQGLAQAASQLQGQRAINAQNAMSLVQALLGAQQAAQPTQAAPSDAMGQFLSSLLGGSAPETQVTQQPEPQPTDLLSGLMGALTGGGVAEAPSQVAPSSQTTGGMDLASLLTAGAAFLQAKQQGASPLEAIVKAMLASSQLSATPHHSQSGQLVASTLLSTIGNMLSGKKR